MAAGFIQYMRAHGHTPGPTQRPLLTGGLAGGLGSLPALALLSRSGGLSAVAATMDASPAEIAVGFAGLFVLGGVAYARVFGRAANDRSAGWLFGISFGFLLWMVGPATVVYWITLAPVATGRAAVGVFVAHALYGLALGVLVPPIHGRLQRRAFGPRQKGV
jgi:hypothetical protein